MNVCPVNALWIHTFLLEPPLQGVELINMAWKGVELHSLTHRPLSLKERIVCLIQGLILLIPLINTIIWLAWQTFGNPVKLFNPFSPEGPPVEEPIPQALVAPSPLNAAPIFQPLDAIHGNAETTEFFAYHETGEKGVIKTHWKVDRFAEMTVAQLYSSEYSSTAICTHAGLVREYHYQNREINFDIWLTDPKHVRVRITKEGKSTIDKVLEKDETIPWIQQPTLGFKNFILSDQDETFFYGILPDNPVRKINPFAAKPPLLMKALAKKIGLHDVPGYGQLMKVEVVSDWGWPYNILKGELWFDPPGGASPGTLRKFIDPGLLVKKTGQFILT